MRVLLFVQTGDGRPKCVGPLASGGSIVSMGPEMRRDYRKSIEGWWLSGGKQGAMDSADRWWLVECDCAECGRAIIHAATTDRPNERVTFFWRGREIEATGRILASGGKP